MSKILLSLILIFSFFLYSQGFAQYVELIGEVIELKVFGDKDLIHLGVDKPNFDSVIAQKMSQDRGSYLMLFMARRGYELNDRTLAYVLDVRFSKNMAQIRVLDGPYLGKVGWVLLENVIGY